MDDHSDRLAAALAGRYTIERELGQGGMATVWLARDLRHERLVALKVLRPELAASLGPERLVRSSGDWSGARRSTAQPAPLSSHVAVSARWQVPKTG